MYLFIKSDMYDGDVDKVVGGLEFSIKFLEVDDRDYVIYLLRGVGWFLLFKIDCDEEWLDKEDLFKKIYWRFCLNISKVWIFLLEFYFFYVLVVKLDKNFRVYVRYKFYNKGIYFFCI